MQSGGDGLKESYLSTVRESFQSRVRARANWLRIDVAETRWQLNVEDATTGLEIGQCRKSGGVVAGEDGKARKAHPSSRSLGSVQLISPQPLIQSCGHPSCLIARNFKWLAHLLCTSLVTSPGGWANKSRQSSSLRHSLTLSSMDLSLAVE